MDIILANPRGFCAGVDRAIAIVERALAQHGAPIYVRHEVVHNKFVVDDLKREGRGVRRGARRGARRARRSCFPRTACRRRCARKPTARGLNVFDATCPLVTKVHVEVAKMRDAGPRDRDDRPRRAPGGRGHDGPGRRAASTWSNRSRTSARLAVRDPAHARLRDADHAVGGRCGGGRRRAEGALSRDRRAEEGRHLLRDAEPAGCGEGDGAEGGRR